MKILPILATLVLVLVPPAHASSVAQVTFQELVLSSELVFEGRVLDERGEVDSRGMIHTFVTFEITSVLKGAYPDSQITLRYLGGTAGTLRLDVADLVLPEAGERGIYFVESVKKFLAHPLYGWDQGHFVVMTSKADKAERVFSRSLKPVLGVQAQPGKASGISTGIAAGLVVGEPAQSNQAITVSDFKRRVQEVIAR